MDTNHDELLKAAVEAQADYERALRDRDRAFLRAVSATVTQSEIARNTGLPRTTVASIVRRKRMS